MGIQGLLPQLKPIQNPVSLHRYEGQTLGIDGYAWLHRAACSCPYELVMGKPTAKYLQFFIKKLSMLKSFKIEPYLIFDGDSIVVKKETEIKRREKRIENKNIAERLWQSGEKKNAMDYFQKCVDVTPEMAKCIIDYCKVNAIQYVVAPFEADAQMVYLEKKNIINGIISEDSDLLIFGCNRLITKLNDYGECIEICRDDFTSLPHKFPLSELSEEEIRTMVCLSGCDYTNGVPKIGLITAIKLVKRFRTIDRILLNIQREGKFKIPEEFLQEYQLANFAFQYQRVFCPMKRRIVPLNDIPKDLSSCEKLYESIGHVIHKDTELKQCIPKDDDIHHMLHFQVALGELSPYDCHKRLINREHKLQLSSKSELNVEGSTKIVEEKILKPIDSFFTRIKTTQNKPRINVNLPDKMDETIKRRRLTHCVSSLASSAAPTTSKFFHTQSCELQQPSEINSISMASTQEDDIETEVPESQIPTQIPSSFVPITTQEDENSEEEPSEILSEVDIEEHPTEKLVINSQLASSHPRNIQGCSIALQKFRYSSSKNKEIHTPTQLSSSESRQPLKSKNINKGDRIVYVSATAKDIDQLQQKQQSQRPTLRHTIAGARSQRVIVTANPTLQEQQPMTSTSVRPALRSNSLSSRFVYRGK